jgi:hypothetical protein
VQVRVASLNTTIDAMLLAELGIEYNVSDSDSDSDSGGGIISASLSIDFVQRFNFSVAEDGTISFLSPQARTEGYVPMLVFDKAGASTVLAESIFYNLKARAVFCEQPRIAKKRAAAAHSRAVAPHSIVQCPEIGWYGSGEACTPCPKVRCACATLPLVLTNPLKHLRIEPFDLPRRIRGHRCRSWAGRNVSRRLPSVAARRVLE